ncbi:MAG: hemolysin family protein [Nanoarchaeota archaeon]|nr:hemolysin family protein [Nanoarchaeota archaeon]
MLSGQIITLIILIILSAFFSGIEVALISLSMVKVRTFLRQKKKGSEALYRLKQNPHRLIITILIGNNLVNIGAAALATVIFTNIFGSSGVGIATGIMTFLILVFGEITPKTFATHNAEKVSLTVARLVEILSYILYPFVRFFEAISRLVLLPFKSGEKKKISEEELRTIVTISKEEGLLSVEAAEMIRNILRFEKIKTLKIMTPKKEIRSLEGDSKLKDVIDFVVKTPYSRYPVYLKKKIKGLLDVDDLLEYTKNKKLNTKVKEIIRPIFFVKETGEIDDLLVEFEEKQISMAIALNKEGKVTGLVTVEDVLEEIVGDIFDKNLRENVHIKRISPNLIRVDAKATVEEINKALHLGLKEKHFQTIAGFVQHKLKQTPKKGDSIKLRNVIIEVDKITKQGIKSLKIIKI